MIVAGGGDPKRDVQAQPSAGGGIGRMIDLLTGKSTVAQGWQLRGRWGQKAQGPRPVLPGAEDGNPADLFLSEE